LILGEFLYSAGWDTRIIKWKISTDEVIWNFVSSLAAFSLEEFAGVLYIGLGENSYCKFNIENGSLIYSITGSI
jgi:outer membrane protein assembly factor BamB